MTREVPQLTVIIDIGKMNVSAQRGNTQTITYDINEVFADDDAVDEMVSSYHFSLLTNMLTPKYSSTQPESIPPHTLILLSSPSRATTSRE